MDKVQTLNCSKCNISLSDFIFNPCSSLRLNNKVSYPYKMDKIVNKQHCLKCHSKYFSNSHTQYKYILIIDDSDD